MLERYDVFMTDTKTRILEAASKLFLKGGSKALSVRAIAAQAGLSTIGIYSHFQGKQGILDSLYTEAYGFVSDAMDVETDGVSARDAVLQAARNYLDNAEHHEAHYRLIFGEGDGSFEPSLEAQQAGADAFKRLQDLVAPLLPESAAAEERQDAALQIWALIHGWISLKHHAVAQVVDMTTVSARAMKGVEFLVDATLANSQKSDPESDSEG